MALGRVRYVPDEESACPRCGTVVVRMDITTGVDVSADQKKIEMSVDLYPRGCTLRPCNHHFDVLQGKDKGD